MKWKALQVCVLAVGVSQAAGGQMMFTVTPENQPAVTDSAVKLKAYSDLNLKLAADTDGADSACLKSYGDFQACKAGDPKAKCGKAPKCSVTAPLTMAELSGIRFHFVAGSDAATLEPLAPIVVHVVAATAAAVPNTSSAPTKVPKDIQMVKEDVPPPASGGVMGMSEGIGGGAAGGVLGQFVPARPMMISGGVISGNIVTKVQPLYPSLAKVMHLSGTVSLRALITKEGTIDSLSVMTASNPMFEMAAVNAVRQWKYKPYVLNGEPTMVDTTVTVNFTLNGTDGAKP